ncbi:MAG: type II secretion system secretin GspD [Pseudomonadota bacterium]
MDSSTQQSGLSASPNISASSLPPATKSSEEPRTLLAEDNQAEGFSQPIIDLGTRPVIGSTRASTRSEISQNDSGDVTLNVVDAEIRDVVRLVLEDALGANYAIDPAVTGKITVRTSRPIPANDVVATLGSILSLNGVALVEADGLYRVLPAERAAFAGYRPIGRIAGRSRGAASGIQVAPLSYADAGQLAGLLQPFVDGQGSVQIDVARNTLLLVGLPDQIASMNDLIEMFDVDWMQGMSFGLYPLESVGATQIATELDEILADPSVGTLSGGVRLVPIDRLSALIVISSHPDSLKRVATWIDRLDKEGQGDGVQVYVYEVQNARATDLASVLGELFDIQSTSFGGESLLAPGLEPVSLGAPFSSFEAADDIGDEERAAPTAREGGQRDAVGIGQSPSRQARQALTEGRSDSDAKIVADETNNALLVRATPQEYKKIEGALRALDKQPLQVLLEATIAEVSLTNELSYGVQWFFGSGDSGVTLSEFTDGSVGQLFPGFSGLLSRGDVRIVLNALDSVSEVNVVSSPQLLVLDNQTAQLQVGDEVPIVTQQAEGIETSDARIVNTVEQRQTGVILSVTPRVNANGRVILDIEQEVSDVVQTTTSGIDSPTIAQRRISTSVVVSSDQTVVLGGLIEDDVDEINTGVPLLKDIPFIGALFSATTKVTDRKELLVMITPKVLKNPQDAIEATEEIRRRFYDLEPLQEKLGRDRLTIDPVEKQPATRQSLQDRRINDTSNDNAYFVELASTTTAVDAWGLWDRVQADHAEDFSGLTPLVVARSSGATKIYSLRVGPFDRSSEPDRVEEICSLLRDEKLDCRMIDA